MCLGDRIEGSQPQRLSVSAAFTFRMIFPRQTLEKIPFRKTSPLFLVLTFGLMLTPPLGAKREKRRPADSAGKTVPSYKLPQSENEIIDYDAYQSIRKEGTTYSHVIEYASALMDAIGSRLTGSPNAMRANEWTRDQLKAMGCTNAHLEDWGEFGMSWQQLNTSVRITSPGPAVLIAQASPWSPSTGGPVSGLATWVDIKEEKDFEKYRGKLAGRIVLFGEMRDVKPVEKPLFARLDEGDLKKVSEYPLEREDRAKRLQDRQDYLKKREFREKTGQFLAAEHVLGVLVPSRDGRDSGGSGGTFFDDTGSAFGRFVYRREHAT